MPSDSSKEHQIDRYAFKICITANITSGGHQKSASTQVSMTGVWLISYRD